MVNDTPPFRVCVCPDYDTAVWLFLASDGFLTPPEEAMQSTDGRYAWSAWNWPAGLIEMATQEGCTVYPYDDGEWKVAAGWTDKQP